MEWCDEMRMRERAVGEFTKRLEMSASGEGGEKTTTPVPGKRAGQRSASLSLGLLPLGARLSVQFSSKREGLRGRRKLAFVGPSCFASDKTESARCVCPKQRHDNVLKKESKQSTFPSR
ncbi:Hypothetical predicted protein [Cloeon dipterum]|uniref:Uncharacterized protein n=1 Tax=Cloeon dipterum TaxID=197152 RepID=A0A8S1BNK6_9INSE|nr:Hypothetical predicted protein [Cloeon dipterum]